MKGLKVINDEDKGYQFCELIKPIEKYIKEYYWIITESSSSISFYTKDGQKFKDWENKYNEIVLKSNYEKDIKLLTKGFMNKYANFIVGDWTEIYAINKLTELNEIDDYDFNKSKIKKNAEIYFSCIDAGFWEIYSKEKVILDLIKKEFYLSRDINLLDKKY